MSEYRSIRFASLKPDERIRVFGASQMSLCGNEGAEAKRWLSEIRGLDIQTISSFRLGYVPFSSGHAFAGRIVMPIFDSYSNLIALSVRPATNEQKVIDECGKYWNESYEKGWNLFGLNLARLSIVRMGFAILVEGQFDVMAMHAFGFTNTVGVLGGAFTPMQAELIKRWTSQLVLMFDGDEPGKKHANRCLEVLSYYGWVPAKKKTSNIFRSAKVTLPSDSDPNDFLRKQGAWPMRKILMDSMKQANVTIPREWLN